MSKYKPKSVDDLKFLMGLVSDVGRDKPKELRITISGVAYDTDAWGKDQIDRLTKANKAGKLSGSRLRQAIALMTYDRTLKPL